MSRTTLLRRFSAVALAVASLALLSSVRASEPKEGRVEAIWHVQSIPLKFKGLHVLYSCEAFQKKLKNIMIAVGAHPSLIIEVGCQPNAVNDRINSRIALATPMVASEENIHIATTYDARRELLARMHNTPLPTAASIERFEAEWQAFELGEKLDMPLEPSDCELVQALSEEIFPKIGVETVRARLSCESSISRLTPSIRVLALLPVPPDSADRSK